MNALRFEQNGYHLPDHIFKGTVTKEKFGFWFKFLFNCIPNVPIDLSQHWFRVWLGIKQATAITWINAGLYPSCPLALLSDNELKECFLVVVVVYVRYSMYISQIVIHIASFNNMVCHIVLLHWLNGIITIDMLRNDIHQQVWNVKKKKTKCYMCTIFLSANPNASCFWDIVTKHRKSAINTVAKHTMNTNHKGEDRWQVDSLSRKFFYWHSLYEIKGLTSNYIGITPWNVVINTCHDFLEKKICSNPNFIVICSWWSSSQ